MRALSLEVRQLIVDAYERGVGSHDVVGPMFGASGVTSRRLVRQWRETGDLSVTYDRSGPIARVPDELLLELKAFVLDGRSDWSVERIKEAWTAHKGVSLHRSSMVRAIGKLDLSLKKSRSSQARKTGLTLSKGSGSSSARSST